MSLLTFKIGYFGFLAFFYEFYDWIALISAKNTPPQIKGQLEFQ
jgi:hypothetical protein